MPPSVQGSQLDVLEFGRRYMGPLLELLLGWVLLVYGVLRLLGRVQQDSRDATPVGDSRWSPEGSSWGTPAADSKPY
jgi:hypothetical protein